MSWETQNLGLTEKQLRSYSILKAIDYAESPADTRSQKRAEFERDVSKEICKRDNRETKGIIIPQEVLNHPYEARTPLPRSGHILTDQVIHGRPARYHQRSMLSGTDSAGGYLVDSELRSLIDVLVENTLALQNVPSYDVQGDPVHFPGQSARLVPNWTTETGTAPTQDLSFFRVSMSSKHLKTYVPMSRTLLLQSSTDVEEFIRNDIAIGIAKAFDSAVLFGTGADNQPTGIKNTSNINTVSWDANNIYDKILDAQVALGLNNVPTRNVKFITSRRFVHDARRAQKLGLYSEVPVVDRETGQIDGIDVEVTSQITGTTGFLADWMEGAITLWQDLEIESDPYTLLHQSIIRLVATLILDIGLLRPYAFVYIS